MTIVQRLSHYTHSCEMEYSTTFYGAEFPSPSRRQLGFAPGFPAAALGINCAGSASRIIAFDGAQPHKYNNMDTEWCFISVLLLQLPTPCLEIIQEVLLVGPPLHCKMKQWPAFMRKNGLLSTTFNVFLSYRIYLILFLFCRELHLLYQSPGPLEKLKSKPPSSRGVYGY